MVDDQIEAIYAIKKNINEIEHIIHEIYLRLVNNASSKLIYAGAGTTIRIGVQDGAELLPTFGWPKKRIGFIIAGGKKALLEPVENAEDDEQQAREDVFNGNISNEDVVMAISASGNTPYTCMVATEAKNKGALVVGISNNKKGILLKKCSTSIILDTGSEVIVGSTRLKAGTAQKMCLNIISSYLMVKMGRVKNGQMTHMVVTNQKLKERKKRITNYKYEE